MVCEFKIVLASSSPRRIELMKELGLDFIHEPPQTEEDNVTKDPVKRVEENSFRKAQSVQKQHPNSLIIGSDTVVYLEGEIFGKPVDEAHASKILFNLSGKCNRVYTGVTVLNSNSGKTDTRHDCTKVWFRELSEQIVQDYVTSGEPLGKAGAYGIQGKGGDLIDRIDGSYSNVVGLPLELLSEILEYSGVNLYR